jgi:hypothetical protein
MFSREFVSRRVSTKDYIVRPTFDRYRDRFSRSQARLTLVNVGRFDPPSRMFRGDEAPRGCRAASIGKQGKTRRS